MSVYHWLIYSIIALLSFLPLVRIDLFSTSRKYTYFKYLSITLFLWTLINGFSYVIKSSDILYTIMLLKYPIIFLAVSLILISLFRYLRISISKTLVVALTIFFTIDLLMALTNHSTQYFLQVTKSPDLVIQDLLYAEPGIFFYVHTSVAYIILVLSIVIILRKMFVSLVEDKDVFPFVLVLVSITVGLTVNIIHIFVYQFRLDPTYIVFVAFTSVLYFIFYIRDVNLIIKVGNNNFILRNIREMYLVVNYKNEVVDASETLLNRFSINIKETKPLSQVMKQIKEEAIVYSNAKSLEKDYDKDKYYIHIKTKDINIPFLKYPGYLILFYDETQIQKYIHDMDYVMNHDLMTDLYNRNYLESIRKDYQDQTDYTCILFDLDGLKLFNDYRGHHAGDDLLKRFADALMNIEDQRSDVIAIRMGGDEFLLIVHSSDENYIQSIIDDIQAMCHDKDQLKNVGFSYGYASKTDDQSFSQVLSQADINLYEMKETRKEAKNQLEEALKKNKKITD